MAIYRPGWRPRNNVIKKRASLKRQVVAVLSLTAMVDMFTVLTIFLLQNYNATGKVIEIPKELRLPKASANRLLDPAFVVNVSVDQLSVGSQNIMAITAIRQQEEWLIEPLFNQLRLVMQNEERMRARDLRTRLQETVEDARSAEPAEKTIQHKSTHKVTHKITVQADRDVDFLTIKKIMYTATEAGAGEINFAVLKREDAG